MKTKMTLMALFLAWLIASLTSCKKEGAIVPQVKPTDSTQNISMTNLPGRPK